jgi:hypothetical protein
MMVYHYCLIFEYSDSPEQYFFEAFRLAAHFRAGGGFPMIRVQVKYLTKILGYSSFIGIRVQGMPGYSK